MSYDEVRDIMGEPDSINEYSFSVGSDSHWQCYTFPNFAQNGGVVIDIIY